MRLTPADWRVLVRFLAAQDVRTPARLLENLQWFKKAVPAMLDNTLRNSVSKLEEAHRSGVAIKTSKPEYIPLRVTTEIEPGQDIGKIKAEIVMGRGLWLFNIKNALTKTVEILHNLKWTILIAPAELTWFTSDDPVVRLNYYPNGTYDFKGGWGNPGTEIFLPLDQRHLLYTKVGARPRRRGTVVSRDEAEMIRRFIAEHAHRFIFAASPDAEVPRLRPRTVDPAFLRSSASNGEGGMKNSQLLNDSYKVRASKNPAHLRLQTCNHLARALPPRP
jgi:hypothetical protein